VPNNGLAPERSDTVEAGLKFDMPAFALGAAYYRSFLSNFLDDADATYNGASQIDGKPVRQRVNRQSGTYDGVEGSITGRFWRLTLTTQLTWTRGEVEQKDGTFVPGRRIPPLFGRAGLRYDHPDETFFVELFTLWAGQQTDLNPGDKTDLRICETTAYSGTLKATCNEGPPGWATLNARGGWNITKVWRLDLAVLNIADARYRYYGSGIDAPGIDGRVSVGARF
jgi:hemoglobin/transferrin/lactoferrin receptor protein